MAVGFPGRGSLVLNTDNEPIELGHPGVAEGMFNLRRDEEEGIREESVAHIPFETDLAKPFPGGVDVVDFGEVFRVVGEAKRLFWGSVEAAAFA